MHWDRGLWLDVFHSFMLVCVSFFCFKKPTKDHKFQHESRCIDTKLRKGRNASWMKFIVIACWTIILLCLWFMVDTCWAPQKTNTTGKERSEMSNWIRDNPRRSHVIATITNKQFRSFLFSRMLWPWRSMRIESSKTQMCHLRFAGKSLHMISDRESQSCILELQHNWFAFRSTIRWELQVDFYLEASFTLTWKGKLSRPEVRRLSTLSESCDALMNFSSECTRTPASVLMSRRTHVKSRAINVRVCWP